MALFLGLDVSTSAAKALVIDGESRVVARGVSRFKPLSTTVKGRAEQEPSEWIDGVRSATQQALKSIDPATVKAVGVSGQQHGLVALSSEGGVIRPAKLWCDVESATEAMELSKAYGFELVPGFTASKLLWMKRKEPHNFARLQHVLLPHDYVNYWLTGRYCMEAGDASGTGFFDLQQRQFSEERMREIDANLHTFMPDLVNPDEAIGVLTGAVASELGLSADVLVAPGSGDNACSAMGTGAVEPGVLVASLGTSATLFGGSAAPVWDPSGTIAPFCDATGQWLPLICTQNCSQPAEEVCAAFGMSREQLTALAAEEEPGCQGVNFLPYLSGERTPNLPHAHGAILGLSNGCLRPGLLYRAALEGATFSLYAGMQHLKKHGVEAKELRIVGGGSSNQLWCQIVADVFQLPVRAPLEAESAAMGAALQAAAIHSGTSVRDYINANQPAMSPQVVVPRPETAAAYQQAFERHRSNTRILYQ
mmetsp:Transcript_4603/g.13232  ORF Transcript_4603/g.13232 Transcript_4603/m.13232 type:complete len:479 (+) Transcript_4603:228-1664(+)|eukprot:CAMPEP_0206145692 /NCGR_PEP_ID=MMETSP1473-20131121/28194_1 /ASSEMBLY_ACC=CAM_ASM_001109 /TAXON_ID=1461547 /ORGANISM="Stichococcus sp, Strain RCC1054" /LENGTH=478 /DNA_ID=CAMNT_0053541993 /DNA_START=152 /DNA_END=1588 /DNA_ORIENTATION=+